jgi:acyl-coenzyme A synthetase/AMP-(fatty) acid ligase
MTLIPLSRLLVEGRSDDHPVALRNGALIDFGRLRADVMDTAARFKDCRRAALVCQDSYNFAMGFYGLLHAEADIVLLPNNKPRSLQTSVEKFDLLVGDAFMENGQGKTIELKPIDPERLSLDFLTSGSTGVPKKVSKNLAMLEREIMTLDALWGKLSGCGPVFDTVSHQHVYGLTFKLLWPLMAGRAFSATTHTLWESLFAELPPDAVIVSSPAHLERMSGIAPIPKAQSPRRIFSAGAPLSLAASQQAETILGCRPTEIFGSTETGAFATRCQTKDDEPWSLLPNMAIRCDDNGCLVLHSPFVDQDWLTTADLIEPLPDGFRFLGRADRIAKIEGKRIALAAVEQSLIQLPFVKEAAVAVLEGKPIRLVAAVVPSEKGQIVLNDMGKFRFSRLLRSNLCATLEAAGIPRQWRFVSELPANALGKRCDADICALFNEGT